MRLTPDEYFELEGALLDAFDDFDDLKRVMRRASIPPGEIAPGALMGVIGKVITYAETRDRVPSWWPGRGRSTPTTWRSWSWRRPPARAPLLSPNRSRRPRSSRTLD